MFFENEFTGSLTFLRLLFAVLMGLAPIAVTIVVKWVLYRRRFAEDEVSGASNSALEDFAIALANEINNLRHSGGTHSRRG